jgi:hypothetical protein
VQIEGTGPTRGGPRDNNPLADFRRFAQLTGEDAGALEAEAG